MFSGIVAEPLELMTTRQHATDLELVGRWDKAAAPVSRFVSYAALVAHPGVVEVAAPLEFSDHQYTIRALPLGVLVAALPGLGTVDLVLADCSDFYQANYPAGAIIAHEAFLALELDGVAVSDWATAEGRPEWGPYIAGVAQPAGLLDPVHKQPWGVVRLSFRRGTEAEPPWSDQIVGAGALARAGAAIYQGACLNCHAAGAGFGGTVSTRTLPILALHARTNRPYFEQMLKDPVGTLPTAAKMPAMPHYGPAEIDRLVAFLDSVGPR